MKTVENVTNWLIEESKNHYSKGFAIDFTIPSVAGALAIHCAMKSKQGCIVIATEDSKHLITESPGVAIVDGNNPSANTIKTAEIAHISKSLVVQTYDKIELKIIRPWPARFCFVADLLPFSSLFRRDINAMFASIADMESDSVKQLFELEARDHYSSEVKFSFDELEWAYRTNFEQPRLKGIITNQQDPTQHNMWGILTVRQRQIVAALHQRHKMTNNRISSPVEFK